MQIPESPIDIQGHVLGPRLFPNSHTPICRRWFTYNARSATELASKRAGLLSLLCLASHSYAIKSGLRNIATQLESANPLTLIREVSSFSGGSDFWREPPPMNRGLFIRGQQYSSGLATLKRVRSCRSTFLRSTGFSKDC